jgi:hypothetical protein
MPLQRCEMAIEASSGNMDYAYEILMGFQEVEQMHPDPNDKVYQQLLSGMFEEYGEEMM